MILFKLFLADLDFAALARAFALLRMPKMPELRGKSFPNFQEEAVDTDTIRFKDKNREKQRQKRIAEQKEKPEINRKSFIKNKSWSKQKNKKERRKKNAAKRKREEVQYIFVSAYHLSLESVKCDYLHLRTHCLHFVCRDLT